MKKIIIIFTLIFLFNINPIFALEEVELEKENLKLSGYGDYLADAYYGRVENAPTLYKLFSKKGLEFENSFINSVKLSFLYSGELSFLTTAHKGQYLKHDFSTVEPAIMINFNNNKTQAMFDINVLSNISGYSNHFTQKLRRVYVSHKITDNQKIVFGQYTRLPSTYDGSRGIYMQDTVEKTQLGRTFGNTMSVGVRNLGSYKYVDYDIGIYDSTRFMQQFGKGMNFTGHIMFKPFANCSQKTGELKIGTSYNIGKNNISYNQYSFFAGYDKKKLHAKIEYAAADGYNGIYESRNSAEGFYATLAYDLTSKLTMLARYDVFDYNTHKSNDTKNEYTVGITYHPFENIKFLINYVNASGKNQPTSNAILFATRFIL